MRFSRSRHAASSAGERAGHAIGAVIAAGMEAQRTDVRACGQPPMGEVGGGEGARDRLRGVEQALGSMCGLARRFGLWFGLGGRQGEEGARFGEGVLERGVALAEADEVIGPFAGGAHRHWACRSSQRSQPCAPGRVVISTDMRRLVSGRIVSKTGGHTQRK